jgi:hypothetical protein
LSFTQHTGRDLDAVLEDELSGSELERARRPWP